MTSAQSLVLINIISVILLCLTILFYYYIFPKRRPPYILLVFLFCLLPIISLLRPGTYESGDISFHITESFVFYESLAQGIFFPIWAGDMNNTFGYPAFLFIYPLPFYLSSIFHFLGFSFTSSIKLVLALSYLLSGLFMFLWLREKVKESYAFVGSLFYLYAPYHLVDLHFRVALGEVVAFAIIPILFLSFELYLKTKSYKMLILESIAVALLVLSHPAISLSSLFIFSIYILIFSYEKKDLHKTLNNVFKSTAFLLLGLGLASFYLIPVIFELKFTQQEAYSKLISFVDPALLLFSKWYGGFLFQGPKGELSFLIGYSQILLILMSVILLFKDKFKSKNKKFSIYLLSIALISIFLMLEISSVIWHTFPLVSSFQFTSRLLVVNAFAVSALASLALSVLKMRWITILICIFVVLSTILNWGNRRNIPAISDKELKSQIVTAVSTGGGFSQAATKWADPKSPWAKETPIVSVKIVEGVGGIEEIKREITSHKYIVNAVEDLVVKENTLFFPGWTANVDEKQTEIKIQDTKETRGIISFEIKKGIHLIEVEFIDTIDRVLGKLISAISAIIIFFFFCINKFNKRISHRISKETSL